MYLTDYILKPVFVNTRQRAISLGLGISLKNYAVKYLLCNTTLSKNYSNPSSLQTDCVISISALQSITQTHIELSSLRPVSPKSCAKITLGKPVYLQTGEFLGTLQNMEIQNGFATRIFTEKNSYSVREIRAVSDAVLLQKTSAYPLGQRIPAPTVFDFLTKKDVMVTKTILKKAIEKSALISFTLSLPPFSQNNV